jgi:capsular polysaccharide export protein
MIREGLAAFRGQSVLLLQGPMGPFFRRLADDLRAVGARVHKVNFNAGDALFYPRGALAYRGTLEDWPRMLAELLDRWQVDVVLMFGDCRPIHAAVRDLVLERGCELGVFEEGYVRPDYITLERFGVNGHSRLPRQPGRYRTLERSPPDRPERVGNAYWHGVLWSTVYATAATLGSSRYPAYRHHRPLDAVEALRWIRSIGRKWICAVRERGVQDRLCGPDRSRYFLVPLQVHNDAQVRTHSSYPSVEAFIDEVVQSFAAHAPADTLLALKHHPMDRPYADHGALIRRAARAAGVGDRVIYIHDQHLPTLLAHARGVVLINSTVGLQALHHGCAVKACGRAVFDMPGLTFQGGLAAFWSEADHHPPDAALLARFQQYLVSTTQINGSFYRRLASSKLASGVRWSPSSAPDELVDRQAEARVDEKPTVAATVGAV